MNPEFKEFSSIKKYAPLQAIVTEKIHGTNAQIYINAEEGIVQAGSRNRWLTPISDNYGFAFWVENHKQELLEKLGTGRHFGEWYGSGINSGYGLKVRKLALFNVIRPYEKGLPDGVDLVPTLGAGFYSPEMVELALENLKKQGSYLVSGFMRPEGVVIHFPQLGHSMKAVFDDEATGWRKGAEDKVLTSRYPVEKLFEVAAEFLQAIRLEKLLSRDERYLTEFPKSLPTLVKDYLIDLAGDCPMTEDQMFCVKKAIYVWVKQQVEMVQKS